jgi:hypothetical protein
VFLRQLVVGGGEGHDADPREKVLVVWTQGLVIRKLSLMPMAGLLLTIAPGGGTVPAEGRAGRPGEVAACDDR